MVLLLCLLIGFSVLHLAFLFGELSPLQGRLRPSTWTRLRWSAALGALLPFVLLIATDAGRQNPLPPPSAEASLDNIPPPSLSILPAWNGPEAFTALEQEEPDIHWLVQHYAARHGVDPLLVLAVIQAESQFNARAVSHKGAMGLMQITKDTAEYLGLRDPFDVRENIEGGVRYLQILLERHSWNLTLALASYNAGPAKVDRYGGIPPYPETQRYIARVMARYKNLKRMAETFRHRQKPPAPPLFALASSSEEEPEEKKARPAAAAPKTASAGGGS